MAFSGFGSSSSAFSTPGHHQAPLVPSGIPLPDPRGFGTTPNRTFRQTPGSSRRAPPQTPARISNASSGLSAKSIAVYSSKKKTAAYMGSPRALSPLNGSASNARKRHKDADYGEMGAASASTLANSSSTRKGLGRVSSLMSSAFSMRRAPVSPLREFGTSLEEEYGSFGMDEPFSDEDEKDEILNDIPVVDYKRTLGEGNFAKVYAVTCNGGTSQYALKEVYLDREQVDVEKLKQWDSLSHPGLVEFYRAWQANNVMYILMQYCNSGTLYDLVCGYEDLGTSIPPDQLLAAMRDCANALQYMHEKKLVHMDIKPQNICLHKGRALLCDFNLMTIEGHAFEEQTDRVYQAKEVLEQFSSYQADPKADIFALGISFFELASMQPLPREGPEWHELRDAPLNRQKYKNVHTDIFGLIEKCMRRDIRKRPSAEALCKAANDALGDLARTIRILPVSRVEDHDAGRYNRPESATLYMSSPRENMTPRQSWSSAACAQSMFSSKSPGVSRAASRNTSPFPRSESLASLGGAGGGGSSLNTLDLDTINNVDAITHRLSQTAVTPRATTPGFSTSRASSPRPFTTSPNFMMIGGLVQPIPHVQALRPSPQRPRSIASTPTI